MTNWQKALDSAVSGQMIESLLPPHIQFLSLPVLKSWADQTVQISWQATEAVHQGSGAVFGGYISALADYIAGAAMLTVLKDGQNFATRKLTTEFKRPIRIGEINISATVTEEREKGASVEVRFINAEGLICATALVEQILVA
ncbi:MAG: PaaI family thioesterase [Pseudomonadales bacterium]|nr:PaaI family thioesterase [Pseudomonadales bacterium]